MKYEFPLPLDRQLGFGLYSAFMAVSRTYKPWLDKLGLTYPQYLVMCVLWEDDDQTIGGIAARLDLESSTMTPLVKRSAVARLVVGSSPARGAIPTFRRGGRSSSAAMGELDFRLT